MKNNSTITLEQAAQYIEDLDFNLIIDKLTKHRGWRQEHALEACAMYKKFLFLQKKYGLEYTLPPSEDIDEFWHMHILDTKRYRKDCEMIFGYYLDHYPYLGIDKTTNFADLEGAFAKTQELYALEFEGKIIPQIRGTLAKLKEFFNIFIIKKPHRYSL